MTQSKHRVVFFAYLFSIYGYLSINIGLPAYPTLQHYFHTNASQVKFSMTVFLFGYAIAQLFWGTLSDRFGRRKIILSANLVTLLGSYLTAVATSMPLFICGRLIEGIGVSYATVISRAILADACNKNEMQIAVAWVLVIIAIMPAVAPIIGGSLLFWFSWQVAYYFLLGFGVLVLLSSHLWLQETCSKCAVKLSLPNIFSLYTSLIKNEKFMEYLLSYSIILGGLITFYVFAPYLFVNGLHISARHYGYLLTLIGGAYIAGTMLTSFLTNKFSSQHILELGFIMTIVPLILFLVFLLARIFNPITVIIPMMFYALGCGFISPTSNALAMYSVAAKEKGSAAALLGATAIVCSSLFSAVTAKFAMDNLLAVTLFLCCVVVAAILILVLNNTSSRV
ncbi:MAG: Bcr/CflA family efflux MFS transporter [Gammaproteobacteria bacterium]|nr:Bcr/CflA family efflux MFS transporter [Gammaproteobacteria bacterium]